MTTDNLLKIVQRYDLYAKQRKYESREKIIKRISDDIQFRMISADVIDPRSGNPTKATIAFSVGYDSRSPDLAARVANELASLYLEQNIESRTRRTADAADFLGSEAQRLSRRIEELQGQIATFKELHLNELPELSQNNQTMLTRLNEELRDAETRIRSLDQQIVYLDAQLAQISPTSQVYTSTGERVLSPADRLKFARTEYARLSGVYAPTHPDVQRLKREISSLELAVGGGVDTNDLQRQLEEANAQLAIFRNKYSADHPDVQRIQRLISSLTDQMAHARSMPEYINPTTARPDNPAYIEIRAQREGSSNERSSLVKKVTALRERVANIEAHLASAPAVERDYSVMVRELENDQSEYRIVRQKQLEADSSQHLEAERKGERMTLIEPPLTPTQPTSPNRTLIVGLGLVLAIACAIGLATLLDLMDTSVRNRQDLTTLVSVPPLAVLPWIETKADRATQIRLKRNSIAGVATAMMIAIVLVHFLYRPLDVLFQTALRWVFN
jgi:uncharacterized protein involved in exopolysaccharide biosynthesis